MDDPHLKRRVEEASLNAWPALQQTLLDGWVLRFARGFTKRANSIVPLYPSQQSPLEKIRYCENVYAREHLKTIFRLTTVDDSAPLDTLLDARGYVRIDSTLVLVRPIESSPALDLRFVEMPRGEWLDAYVRNAEIPSNGAQLHALLLAGIQSEHVFGATAVDGESSACGLAVLERELLGLFDLVTHPSTRRRGHAHALVESLLGWGGRRGARHAYLQVIEANRPARALYERLGFVELYKYWYRVAP
jgi:ribosomal protein S18 acetylase RimI-like enzyme